MKQVSVIITAFILFMGQNAFTKENEESRVFVGNKASPSLEGKREEIIGTEVRSRELFDRSDVLVRLEGATSTEFTPRQLNLGRLGDSATSRQRTATPAPLDSKAPGQVTGLQKRVIEGNTELSPLAQIYAERRGFSGEGTRRGKNGRSVLEFEVPLDYFVPFSLETTEYQGPVFSEFLNFWGGITGLGIFADGPNQIGFWNTEELVFKSPYSPEGYIAGNYYFEVVFEIEAEDLYPSTLAPVNQYPTYRLRVNQGYWAESVTKNLGPSSLSTSAQLAVPFHTETVIKEVEYTPGVNNNAIWPNTANDDVDSTFIFAFDFLSLSQLNVLPYIEYIVRDVRVFAYPLY